MRLVTKPIPKKQQQPLYTAGVAGGETILTTLVTE
jgi:hypothetical protein